MTIDINFAERVANLALAGISRRYPYHLTHVMQNDAEALTPHQLTPLFSGCFDWHSAVHSHWCLARLLRCFPDAAFCSTIRETLSQRLTEENVSVEFRYLSASGREGFERPYGLAWLLQFCAELREWSGEDSDTTNWLQQLLPLEEVAVDRIMNWLSNLSHPIRSGEHSQSAFAMGLVIDWASSTNDQTVADLIKSRAVDFHAKDVSAPIHFEPSGHDFLSPSLAEADLMRRVFTPDEFASWLDDFLPDIPSKDWLTPAKVADETDGKLTHLHGLNLSRAWMLEGMAAGLPAGDSRISIFQDTASTHRDAGLQAVTGQHYSISHWLGSFAIYLMTGRQFGLTCG
jgi:hypothetical protein